MAKMKDQFDQFMYLNVTMSAVNTLTFSEVSLGLSLFDYAGLIISKVQYFPDISAYQELSTNSDAFRVGIVGSNSLTSLAQNQPQVYDMVQVGAVVHGTAGNLEHEKTPITHDFSTMSGGGLLVPAQNMYIAMDTDGFAGLGVASMRVYFRVKALQAGDFVELVQRLRVLST